MKSQRCETIQEFLPDWVAGILDGEKSAGVEEHLSSCAACAAEAQVVRALFESRPPAPEGLEARIQARLREEFPHGAGVPEEAGGVVRLPTRRDWAPRWALSAAALVVLSLGVGVLWEGEPPEITTDPLEVAMEEPVPEDWLWDDGMVAGAPVFDGLTDEELEALIQELEG